MAMVKQEEEQGNEIPIQPPPEPAAQKQSTQHPDIPMQPAPDVQQNIDSFNVSLRFTIPEVEEDTLQDEPLVEIQRNEAAERPLVVYHTVEAGTQRGKPMLLDNRGYSYTQKWQKNPSQFRTTWICSVRSKALRCPASVIQCKDNYVRGKHDHVHPPTPSSKAVELTAKVKKNARADISQSAANVVGSVIAETTIEDPSASFLKTTNLIRTANRARKADRPAEPCDLNFVLNDQALPSDFLRKDIRVGDARHLIFFTADQRSLLNKAKTLYLDGTFKVVRSPFCQLLSVHSFIESDTGDMKHIPLAFCLMSRGTMQDYKKVVNKIKKDLPSRGFMVKEAVVDYELELWEALKDVYGESISIKGCVFHWTQAVWRKCQSLGLQTAYSSEDATRTFVRKLLALPFLPVEHIEPAFKELEKQANPGAITDLCTYIRQTWIQGAWPPADWCVFRHSIRTNDDVGGWHRCLNRKSSRPGLPLYLLINLLHKESSTTPLIGNPVEEAKLCSYQREQCRKMQGRIFKAWENFETGEIKASDLLTVCSSLNGPVM